MSAADIENFHKADTEATPSGLIRRRRRNLLIITAGAVLVSGAGFAASTFLKSPQQLAAEAGPPKPSIMSSLVERRTLRETVIVRGTVAPGKSIEVPPPSTISGKLIVSAPPMKVGAMVHAGTVLGVVSNRPVIALLGKIPAYRDLKPKSEGPDVEQLQSALRGAGYQINDTAGVFGQSTMLAVKNLYAEKGFKAPTINSPVVDEATGDDKKEAGAHSKPKALAYLPASEVMFVPKLPARVTEVKAGLGAEVKGALLKLATGSLQASGALALGDSKIVKRGQQVEIYSDQTNSHVKGLITRVGNLSSDGQSYPVVVRGIHPLPEKMAGEDVRMVIEAVTTAKPVLVVPLSAIYAAADGTSQLVKLDDQDHRQRLTVVVGVIGGGFVEVHSEYINEGDRVMVGIS